MTRKGLYKKRVAAGQCGSCGRDKPVGSICLVCSAVRADYRKRRMAAGLCPVSGCREPPVAGQTKCNVHAALEKMRMSRLRARRKAAGLCIVSGCKDAVLPEHVHCPIHVVMNRANVKASYARRRSAHLAATDRAREVDVHVRVDKDADGRTP